MKKRCSFDSSWCLHMFQPKEHRLKHIWQCENVSKTSAHVDIQVGDHVVWPSTGNVAMTWAMTMIERCSFDSLWCLHMFQPKEHHLKHIWHCENVSKASAHVDIQEGDYVVWPSTGNVATTWAMTMIKRCSFDSLWCLDMFQPKEHHFKHIWHCENVSKAIAHVDTTGRVTI